MELRRFITLISFIEGMKTNALQSEMASSIIRIRRRRDNNLQRVVIGVLYIIVFSFFIARCPGSKLHSTALSLQTVKMIDVFDKICGFFGDFPVIGGLPMQIQANLSFPLPPSTMELMTLRVGRQHDSIKRARQRLRVSNPEVI